MPLCCLHQGVAPAGDRGSAAGRHPGDAVVERDGLYWTAKYMADATSAATVSDPHWGLEGGMTPLAAVFASKWRQQVSSSCMTCAGCFGLTSCMHGMHKCVGNHAVSIRLRL